MEKIKEVLHTTEKAADRILHESQSEAHQLFRAQPGHQDRTKKTAAEHIVPGVEHPGSAGIVYVSERAMANGYYYGNKEWANCGQGAPETGQIPGSVPKPSTFNIEEHGDGIHEYGPTTGIPELREKVAAYYNTTFREGMSKKLGPENICIVPGGRTGLSRLMSVMTPILLGYQVPDYAAYEPLLSHSHVQAIPMQLSEDDNYKLTPAMLRKEIRDRGLSAVLMSNPRNPTGQLIEGEELKEVVDLAQECNVTMILDEFYSWYLHQGELGRSVSSMSYIQDPNDSNVAIIDGLTKNWRCPGWRVCWVVGSKDLITALSQAGSYLDGGASHPMQVLALQMLDPERIVKDRLALQKHFRMKRDHVLQRLEKMGLKIKVEPQASFYIWCNLASLPSPLNSGLVFCEELLKEQCICVPGISFDISPGHRRNIIDSPTETFIRISFGPPLEELDRGMDAFERVLAKSRAGHQLGRNLAKFDPAKVHHLSPRASGS